MGSQKGVVMKPGHSFAVYVSQVDAYMDMVSQFLCPFIRTFIRALVFIPEFIHSFDAGSVCCSMSSIAFTLIMFLHANCFSDAFRHVAVRVSDLRLVPAPCTHRAVHYKWAGGCGCILYLYAASKYP